MSVQRRQNRSPISCTPCRLRKIRCSRLRGPPPCETCVRRHLASECRYADGQRLALSSTFHNAPLSPMSERSTPAVQNLPSNADLAARVASLEALLQTQATNTQSSSIRMIPPFRKAKGTLWTSETGHVRFLPCTIPLGNSRALSDPQLAMSRSVDLRAGPYPLGKKQVEMDQLLKHLPSRPHCRQLKNVFFESFAPLFHILHDPTFNKQYEDFERTPDSMPPSWLALLFAILGTSVMALDPSNDLFNDLSRKELVADQIAELSTRYRNAAFKCLEADNYLWQQNVTTLQALIILIYSINHSHGQTWTLLGMTYHIALSLGCHIDPSEFGLDVIRCEERRRCWAGVMMLFMIQGTSMGHLGPDPWVASEGVQMPSDLNDSQLVAGEHILPLTSSHATQMSYLLLKFRLYEIANEVSSVVRNSIQPPTPLISRLDEKILSEQRSWHDKYLAHSALVELPTHHKAHVHVLLGYSHQLLLLLHNHTMRTSIDSQQCHQSAFKVLHSAEELLRIHTIFFTEPEFSPFRWYLRGIGSFHAYHAAVSLLAIFTERSWNLTHGDIISSVKQCTDRFEALADTSLICSKAVPVLRDMLNTVDTSSANSNNQQWDNNLQAQDEAHGPRQTSSESSSAFSRTAYRHQIDERSDPAHNRPISMLEEFDPQFWITSLGALSQEPITAPTMSSTFSGEAVI